MSFVLDASATLPWCFVGEATGESFALLERLKSDFAQVPPIWALEIANTLTVAERRGRIAPAATTEFLDVLAGLDIRHDAAAVERALVQVLDLARAYAITSYDASYLDLAMREGVPLATRDEALAAAARRVGVAVIAA